MKIKDVTVKNFRLLKDIKLTFDEESTVIVGRNNSGKTSLTEVFKRFFASKNPVFQIEDFSSSAIKLFAAALEAYTPEADEMSIRALLPSISLKLTIEYDSSLTNYGSLGDFIIDFEPDCYSVIIMLKYELKSGKIKELFEELTPQKYIDLLRERIPKLYATNITVIDPTDETNTKEIEYSKLDNILEVDIISAQRGLNDATEKENDVIGKLLGSIFKNASHPTATEEMKAKSDEIENVIQGLQNTVDTDLRKSVDGLLPTFGLFGYPGLSDPRISTQTTLSAKSLLESSTKIRYDRGEGLFLPESYNGLGARNLIYMLIQLFELFRKYQSNQLKPRCHIIFIEEPEVHLHPQMQEVFIKQLCNIKNKFCETLNNDNDWQIQFVVSTHSTHLANQANVDAIRYFLSPSGGTGTVIKDLRECFLKEDVKEYKDFIHKYLTLTRCDLFFADKAILIEGATERILMPKFIEKVDAEFKVGLCSEYITTLEVGGAYAHRFYKFLEFLELRTLIITDIDSIDNQKIKCIVSNGFYSSNAGISKWFSHPTGYMPIETVMKAKESDKIKGTLRIAYQLPEMNSTLCGRSFEDSFMLANLELFGLQNDNMLEMKTFNEANNIDKTDFAIEYAIEKTDWNIPKYIKEGLVWLANGSQANGDTLMLTNSQEDVGNDC